MKRLRLSYDSAGAGEDEEEASSQGESWKESRLAVLKRDKNTCQYCGFAAEKGMRVNHIDGDTKNDDRSNLETVCPQCHMIMHSGLWCDVTKVVTVYKRSRYPQAEIISVTRRMRTEGKSDEEIIHHLGLEEQVPWKADLDYLAPLFGFITSRPPREMIIPKQRAAESGSRNV